MAEIMIKNVPVHFPFEPYDVQKAYMEKVIDCLQTGAHGMLESPTGTGKTLSLLCSSLAWLTIKKAHLQSMKSEAMGECTDLDFMQGVKKMLSEAAGSTPCVPTATEENSLGSGWFRPKIIYASRTHSQLTQAIAEMKRTKYAHMPMAVIGSRDQLCLHKTVSQEQDSSVKMAMCQALTKSRSCHFQRNIERKKDHPAFVEAGVMDIEDLVNVSDRLQVCPYFMSRELKQRADIIFMPYNYVLDPRTRRQQDVDLNNSVIILDEGHNVEKICEDSASHQLSSTDIALCLGEVTAAMKLYETMPGGNDFDDDEPAKDFSAEELMLLKSMLLDLEKTVDSIQLTENKNTELSLPGEYIFDLLKKASLAHDTYCRHMIIMDKIVQYLNTVAGNSPFQRNGAALNKLASFFGVVFNFEKKTYLEHCKDVQECYKVFITLEKPKTYPRKMDSWFSSDSESKPGGKVVNFWCFNPGFGMRNLLNLGVHSIIVTSGTLSPLPPLITELGIPINVTLENGHVIDQDQVYVSVVTHGPDGVPLNSTFKNRGNESYVGSLGRTILNFSRVVPEGLLVFFPSYTVLNSCKESWQMSGIWSQICAVKEIFVEPQSKREFNEVMSGYYARIAQPGSRGACFLAVCRGKVSEGLDFADHNGRAVILTGLPYPPFYDPRVIMKKQYLDKNKKKVSGQNWYQLEATRAVNQAVGRVIRHRNDYGAVLFCDNRFGEAHIQRQFSAWLRPFVQNCSQFGTVTRGLCKFFKDAKNKPSQSSDKSVPNAWTDKSDSSPQAVSATFDTTSRSVPQNRTTKAHQGNFNWRQALSLFPRQDSQPVSSSPSALYVQQDGLPLSSQENRQPKTMFGALEESSQVIDFNSTIDSDSQSSNLTSTQEDSELDPEVFKVESKRKKFKVMGVPLSYEVDQPSGISARSPLLDPGKQERFMIYVGKVKASMSDTEFKEFSSMVRIYNLSSDFDQLTQTLEKLFKNPGQYKLLEGFQIFIKKKQKLQFSTFCQKILSK